VDLASARHCNAKRSCSGFASGDDTFDLLKQFLPRRIDFGRPVGSEKLAQCLGDDAEKLAEQFARRAVCFVRGNLAFDQTKMPAAFAGKIKNRVDGQRQRSVRRRVRSCVRSD
jgi:hypothetical protein